MVSSYPVFEGKLLLSVRLRSAGTSESRFRLSWVGAGSGRLHSSASSLLQSRTAEAISAMIVTIQSRKVASVQRPDGRREAIRHIST